MKADQTKPLQTVLVITVGLAVIYWVTRQDGWLVAAMSIGAIALISARAAEWIDRVWMKLAHVLGLIVPNILLTLVFFLFLWPIAMLSRLFGKRDPLKIRSAHQVSVFKAQSRTFEAKDFENPF